MRNADRKQFERGRKRREYSGMKNKLLTWLGVLGICTTLFILSCSNPTGSKIDDIVFPAKNISYYRTIQPLFNIACGTSGCHDAVTQASNLDLSDYSGIHQRFYDVVIPYDTAKSRLIWRIEGISGNPMPPGRPLTLNQITGFKQWIMEGATDTIP